MSIAQSKRKLIAATALFVAVGSLTGAIATGGAATISYAQQGGDQGGAQDGQQGRIVRQGTVVSSPVPIPGLEEQQRATILPLTRNGALYTGVLTYTATEPVDIVILNMQTLNETERSILNATEDGELGTLTTAPLDNQTSLVITSITPTYGGDFGAPSATIPFAGNAVWLHTPGGEPFAASFAVSAQILPAEMMNSVSNVTTGVTEEAGDGGADGGDEEDGGDEGAAAAANTTATDVDGA